MGEQNVKEKEADKKLLQWHPAFFASIQIELSEEADKLIFEQEHNLGTKSKKISQTSKIKAPDGDRKV